MRRQEGTANGVRFGPPAGADDGARDTTFPLVGYVKGPWNEFPGNNGLVLKGDTVIVHGTVTGRSGLLGLPVDGSEITWGFLETRYR